MYTSLMFMVLYIAHFRLLLYAAIVRQVFRIYKMNVCTYVSMYVCRYVRMCDQSEFMALYVIFNLWVGPGFIFESCG